MILKRELKVNFKSFLIWTGILIILFLAVFLVYPTIMSSEDIELMNEMMKVFPEELLKAFNMDIATMDSAFGYLKTEGMLFIALFGGIYASTLGSSILLKEEDDKTIEYLNTLPVKRRSILLQKIVCSLIYIILFVICIGVFNYIGLEVLEEFDKKLYLLLSITPIFAILPLFAINLFISTFSRKTKKTFSLGLGITLVSYFLLMLSEMSEESEFFKYLSIYTLSDIRNVILNIEINPIMIIISILITLVFIVLSFVRYEKKELV